MDTNSLDISKQCAWRHGFKERRQHVNEHNLVQIPTNKNHRNITDKSISLHMINAISVAGKAAYLCEHITEKCVDLLAITETWLREGDDCHINDHCPPGYRFVGVPRPMSKGAKGGGVGFVIRANIDVICIPQQEFKTFETCIIRLNDNHPVTYVLVYRALPSRQNDLKVTQFLQELEQFLSHLCTTTPS